MVHRSTKEIDKQTIEWKAYENYMHSYIISKVEKMQNIGYRRWKNDE